MNVDEIRRILGTYVVQVLAGTPGYLQVLFKGTFIMQNIFIDVILLTLSNWTKNRKCVEYDELWVLKSLGTVGILHEDEGVVL